MILANIEGGEKHLDYLGSTTELMEDRNKDEGYKISLVLTKIQMEIKFIIILKSQ